MPRHHLSLDGTWTFSPDPRNAGQAERWYTTQGFDRQVTVPSPWQLYGEDMVGYTGYAWYHKAFEAPTLNEDQELALQFDAVDYEAKVWLNGELLGSHEGGYTPFEFPITPKPGTNHLVMRVYDPQDNSEIPHGKQGSWYTRVSGPWQPVRLETRDAVHVTLVHVTPIPQEMRLTVQVEVQAPDGAPVTVQIKHPDGHDVILLTAAAKNGVAEMEGEFDDPVPLWTPESPALHQAVATVGTDQLAVNFGMRWVEYRDGLIYLNGDPLYVRGALDQAFYPETVYRVPSEDAIENEIRLAKAMGLNLLRKHIKLEDPRYLDACDRLGMLIWEEPACFAKYTPQAKDRFRREIEAMVRRDYNHPSIIAWSLYNEEWGLEWRLWKDEEKQAHVEALYDHAKTLDTTRLFCDNSGWAHVKTDINDWHRYYTAPDLIRECVEDLDRCVDRAQENFVASRQANAAGVPVIISEFGVWGLPEVSRIKDWYGGRPWWFDAQWAGHTEEFKYPETAERYFEKYRLSSVFGSMDALSVQCQHRMMRALKPIIEAYRRRADLAGYVVTEFTDIEWESNGWLDYFRKPKAGFEQFAWFNHPLVVMATLDRHNAWSGESLTGHWWVSNHTPDAFEGVVRWRLENFAEVAGETPVTIAPFATASLAELRLTAPSVSGPTRSRLVFELVRDGQVVASNAEELTFSPLSALKVDGLGPIFLAGEAARLRDGLKTSGAMVADTLSRETLLVTTTLDAEARAHLAAGGRALFIAEHGEKAPEKGLISFRRLPRGESWDRAASIMYARPDLFGDLPVGGVLGWELEDVFPHHVVPMSNYLQDFGGRGIELPSNQAHVDPSGVLAGYFEGWLGKFGAVILRLPYDEGELTVTTLRLLEHYDRQPIATLLLHRLAAVAAKPLATAVAK